jgi:hypothetical protein
LGLGVALAFVLELGAILAFLELFIREQRVQR